MMSDGENMEERPSQGRDYHDATLEASVRRIEVTLRELNNTHTLLVPRVEQLERSVFGYTVGTHTSSGLEQQWREALPSLKKVDALIATVKILIAGLVPTAGTLLLYLLTAWGVIGP